MLCAPALLVVEAIAAKGRVAGLGGDPDDDVPVITGGGQSFAFRGPPDNVDGLGVLGEGSQVLDLPVLAISLDLPESDVRVSTGSC